MFTTSRLPRDPSSQRWNYVGEKWPMNFAWNARLPCSIQESFTCRKSTTWDGRLYFPPEGRHAEDFFAPKNPTASAGFEPANLGTKGQHTTSRPPKPLRVHLNIILPSMPGSPKLSLTLRFPHQNPLYASPLPHTCYMPCPSHSSRFYRPNNIGWGVHYNKFLIM